MDFYKCAVINQKNWSGYKAILIDGQYQFQDNLTEYLTYGEAYIPEIGKIYNNNATIKSQLYGIEQNHQQPTILIPTNGLVFDLPLNSKPIKINTSQTLYKEDSNYKNGDISFHNIDNIPCYLFKGDSYLKINNCYNTLPYGNSDRTISLFFQMVTDSKQDDSCFLHYGVNQNYKGINFACNNTRYIKYDIWNKAYYGNIKIQLNKWYHCCYVISNKKITGYINGKIDIENCDISQVNTTQDLYLTVGGRKDKTRFYNGFLSSIRIYNRALTLQEINTLKSEYTIEDQNIEYLNSNYTGRLNTQITYPNGTIKNVITNYTGNGCWENENDPPCLCYKDGCCGNFYIDIPLSNRNGYIGCSDEAGGDCNLIYYKYPSQIPLNKNLVDYSQSIIYQGSGDFPTSVIITKLD